MTAPAGGEGYFGELVRHWRPLLAASLGAGVSLPLFAYVNTVFAPYLLREFGWSRSDFALVGVTSLATLLVLPFIGRFTDLEAQAVMAVTHAVPGVRGVNVKTY